MAITTISNSGKTQYNIKELIADNFGDLPVDGLAVGSTAYVTNAEKHYMLNSSYEWIEISLGSGGGGTGKMEIIPLVEGQYDPETGKPTILGAQEGIIYLVPNTDTESSDLYTEWININNNWEKFGSSTINLNNYTKYTETIPEEINNYKEIQLIDKDNQLLMPITTENQVFVEGGQTLKESLAANYLTLHNEIPYVPEGDYNPATKKYVDDLELYKFPNAVIVGDPNIDNGQISNFSAENYLQFPFIVDVRNKSFEIDICFTTGADVITQQNILDSEFGLALAIQDGKGIMAMSSNGTSWDIGQATGVLNILPNTTYYAKITWDNTTYKTAISTDGTSFADDMTLVSTNGLFPKTIFIGGSYGLFGTGSDHPFSGIINMNKCKLSINDNVIWVGMDDAGLSTRADVSLSNIDEAGKQVIEDISSKNNVKSVNGYKPDSTGNVIIPSGDVSKSYVDEKFSDLENGYTTKKNVGTLGGNGYYSLLDYIPVIGGRNVAWDLGTGGNGTTVTFREYDLTRTQIKSQGFWGAMPKKFKLLDDTAYVNVQFGQDLNGYLAYVNDDGTNTIIFEPTLGGYHEGVVDKVNISLSNINEEGEQRIREIASKGNVVLDYTLIPNTYINEKDGDQASYSAWSSTDFVDVSMTKTLIYKANASSIYNAFYDSNKNFISSFSVNQGEGSIDLTDDVKYVRLSGKTSDMSILLLFAQGVEYATKEYVDQNSFKTYDIFELTPAEAKEKFLNGESFRVLLNDLIDYPIYAIPLIKAYNNIVDLCLKAQNGNSIWYIYKNREMDNAWDLDNIETVTFYNNTGTYNDLNTGDKTIIGAFNELHDSTVFSTSETKIGTWIDNKDLYRRVIKITSGIAKGVDTKIEDKPADIFEVTRTYGTIKTNSDAKNGYSSSDISVYINDEGIFYRNDFSGYADYIYAVIEYTKN